MILSRQERTDLLAIMVFYVCMVGMLYSAFTAQVWQVFVFAVFMVGAWAKHS